jgi:hypothetical protein
MVFVAPPEGLVVHGAALPVGRFQANGDAPWWATGLMLFFHKQEVEIRGPAG